MTYSRREMHNPSQSGKNFRHSLVRYLGLRFEVRNRPDTDPRELIERSLEPALHKPPGHPLHRLAVRSYLHDPQRCERCHETARRHFDHHKVDVFSKRLEYDQGCRGIGSDQLPHFPASIHSEHLERWRRGR